MSLFYMCLKIFFARIIDVSLGTVRTVMTIKGKTFIAPLIAFFEVFIWFLIAKEALTSTKSSILVVISYSAGYAVGTLIGMFISSNFIKGHVRVEVITSKANNKNIERIRKEGYGVSIIDLANSNQRLLLIEIMNKELKRITKIINEIDNEAFITINESKSVYNGFIK